jgi:hypothetical protein
MVVEPITSLVASHNTGNSGQAAMFLEGLENIRDLIGVLIMASTSEIQMCEYSCSSKNRIGMVTKVKRRKRRSKQKVRQRENNVRRKTNANRKKERTDSRLKYRKKGKLLLKHLLKLYFSCTMSHI